ncbi:MAG: hypothetical protein IPN00_06625 [Hydrogenophilales bacterium]|jgi:hypothetical protein|nr:hypothetical protein [Hydrogenophilales bacterium]
MHARLLGFFLLVVALLSGQMAGLRHGANHHESDQDVPHAACQWCGAYGALDLGLAVVPPVLPAMARENPTPIPGHVSRVCRFLPPFRSRAPPAFA